MQFYKLLTVVLILLPVSNASAIDFLIEAGFHQGGDRLVSVTFLSGNTESIDAGDGVSISAGAVADHGSFEMRYKAGIKFDSIDAANGSLDWDRYTFDALAMYKYSKSWKIGAGLTYHVDPELSGSGIISGSAKFDNAVGLMAEVDYFWNNIGYVGLVITAIDYEINGVEFDGNSVGINVGGIF